MSVVFVPSEADPVFYAYSDDFWARSTLNGRVARIDFFFNDGRTVSVVMEHRGESGRELLLSAIRRGLYFASPPRGGKV